MGVIMGYLILLKNHYQAANPLLFMLSISRELVLHTAYYRQFYSIQELLKAVYYKLTKNLIFNSNSEKWERI